MMTEIAFCIGLRETKNELIEVLNKSGLPIDVMDMLLNELHQTVHNQAEAEYQAELAKIQEAEKAKEVEEKKDHMEYEQAEADRLMEQEKMHEDE